MSYTLPKIWTHPNNTDNPFFNAERMVAGARFEQKLPVGDKPLQLYSLGTPSGLRVHMVLEELAESGVADAEYDAFAIDIGRGEQYGSDFVALNPNAKIPALVDYSANPPVKLFEFDAILQYLAEKHGQFIPASPQKRAECMSWLFWQAGSSPYVGGGFGHFFAFAPEPFEYPINYFTLEVKRQLSVLDKHLADKAYLCGDGYTIADMATWTWYGRLALGLVYGSGEFLQVADYPHVQRWAKNIAARPAVQRAMNLRLQAIG
ncbi:glutathione-dependent disulfide-bond oxidoreductase [Testudinibacter sp. TR-2022]|uniref:glutathione-dependent disulfide-bond oxidoreductase n=1 Tax=Testudinibacter sp. TR-2022 TaxID=2585029 RepID=UPI00111B92F9|nr:glutathione-dependent disulfide-bond oxidoreductase [Testudinibacter sp. TR-2022]TNH05505.1 glutathione-dependent disulfide-bond oxidoreductase [Pasteurellaceae bacterium Phil11]TNH23176.1 glutathione-dependent disulfide-bond oxidoreductase [Testudinibacter sp. TR-2022]TNH23648.1 glutathione-dependent disulfide-bond oxidoreductase [Testudinibacter sp. TR-2022]